VMTPRPGRIARVVPIGLGRPRSTDVMRSPEFHALCDDLADALFAGPADGEGAPA
jgi:NitT/TauT family transport system ATP-binding protein